MARKTGRIFGIVLGCFIMCILIASINLVTYAEEAPAPEPELVCSICGKSPGMHPIIIPEWHDCSDPNCCECHGHTVAQIDGVLMCTRCNQPACYFGYEYSLVCSGDHSYSNGFCTACDAYEPAVLNGDVYEISNAGQLYWFAAQVNGGSKTINGKLMNDIVVNENVLAADGTLNEGEYHAWTPIGNSTSKYNGIFDGNYCTISGLYVNDPAADYVGLVGYLNTCAVVKNVGIIDSYFRGNSRVGSIAGYTGREAGIIFPEINGDEDSIVMYEYATISNCFSLAAVDGTSYVGGIVGVHVGKLHNCFSAGLVREVPSTDLYNDSTVSNCYYLTGCVAQGGNTGTAMTAEQFASGEVAYLLQGDQAEQIWGQLIGTDAYPVFSDDKVYLRGDQYSNSDACVHDYTYSFSNSLHTLTCSICDDVQTVSGNNAFSVPYTAVTLGTHIDLQFKAYVDDCFSDVYMVFTVEDSNGEIVETLYPDYKVDATGRWVYTYEGVNPQLMSDTVHATMYGCLNGNLVEVHKSQSVENYCKAVLCMDTVVDAKIRTLVSDLLIYGAMSQKFKGYDVDNLVTDGAVNLTPSVFPGVDGVDGYNSFDDSLVKENTVHDVTRFSMRLSNKVSLKMYMVLDNPELYTYQVSVNGVTFNYDASDLTYDASQNKYYLLFDLMAYEMDAPVSLVILRDGEQVSRKMTCSATGYIKEHGVGEGALSDLLQALYNYGKSAEAL